MRIEERDNETNSKMRRDSYLRNDNGRNIFMKKVTVGLMKRKD